MGGFTISKGFDTALGLKAGDTELIRLILEDDNGAVVDLTSGYTGTLGIKRKVSDTSFIIPEIAVVFHSIERGYTLEVVMDSADTLEALNYQDKERESVKHHYDIEVYDTFNDVRTTVLMGDMNISRSIAGVV